MSDLVVYNSLSRKKEKFEPYTSGQVKMYCCGPTVYDLLHIGNFRGPVFYNLVRKWLEFSGFKVTYAYNYTDVDDKIIDRANQDKVSSSQISEKYIIEFQKDYDRLGLGPHSFNPKVTDYMDAIVKMIADLISKEKAYVVNGEVLFSIRSFPEYGKLSNRDPDDLKAGVRMDVASGKKDPLDFVLWKPAKPGEPSWESPWGAGRPGWHIECSAMTRDLFGEQIDIHGGGMDLIFPHHENEIAQSEGCSGKQLAKYWMHNNMINFSGAKMSKSLGNIRTLRSFMDEFNPEIFKYMILSAHYRSVSEFGEQVIEHTVHGLARIYSALALAESLLPGTSQLAIPADAVFEKITNESWGKIKDALNDDFNSPEVFAALFEVVRQFNTQVKRGIKANPAALGKCHAFVALVRKAGNLMALFQLPAKEFLITLDDMLLRKKNLLRATVDQLVHERAQARVEKNFAKSDELRAKLTEMGISVSDTVEGSFWEVTK